MKNYDLYQFYQFLKFAVLNVILKSFSLPFFPKLTSSNYFSCDLYLLLIPLFEAFVSFISSTPSIMGSSVIFLIEVYCLKNLLPPYPLDLPLLFPNLLLNFLLLPPFSSPLSMDLLSSIFLTDN
jgi:hypothetical protein